MDIEEIKKIWFLGAESEYTDEEVIEGFSTIKSLIGDNFIDTKWQGQKGIAPANQIISLGLNLNIVSKIKGFDKLKERLLNSSTFRIAVSELACAVPFAKQGVLVELYPANPDKVGELEMKLDIPQVGIAYVEVVSPQTQVWDTFLIKTVNHLKEIARKLSGIRLEVYAYEVLNAKDVELLYSECQKVIDRGMIGTETIIDGKFHIFLSNRDVIKINLAEKKTDEQSTLFSTNIAFGNVITIGVPFADKRAEQVLEGEYHQMTKSFPNIIVIDLSGVPNGMKNWPQFIKRRLQPTLNRKISAVMLRSHINSDGKPIWIVNQHAHHTIKVTEVEKII